MGQVLFIASPPAQHSFAPDTPGIRQERSLSSHTRDQNPKPEAGLELRYSSTTPRTPPGRAHLRRHALGDARARARSKARTRGVAQTEPLRNPPSHAHLRKHARGDEVARMQCPALRKKQRDTSQHATTPRGPPRRTLGELRGEMVPPQIRSMQRALAEQQSPRPLSLARARPWDALSRGNRQKPTWRRRPPPQHKRWSGNTECSQCPAATPSPQGTREATGRERRRHKFKKNHAERATCKAGAHCNTQP